jgi:antitoxin component of MazEF toxin-antitoxin module
LRAESSSPPNIRFTEVGMKLKRGALLPITRAVGGSVLAAYSRCILCMYVREETIMIVEFRKWGNCLAVCIPKALAETFKLSDGKRAEINVENGALVLRPIVTSARKPSYTLDELLSGMTRNDVPQEIDWV